VLHTDRESALSCQTGGIVLAHCEACDLVFNEAFEPERVRYCQPYDNSLFFSPTFREYSRKAARRLVETYGIRHKRVLDVGSGNGDFLELLVETGANRGVGVDPGGKPAGASTDAVSFRQEPFHPGFLDPEPALIASRYVLEHVQEPLQLLGTIRDGLKDTAKTILYFEVPNAFLILRSLSVWDIIYEHCVYFTPLALQNAFKRAGFAVLRVADEYGGQFLAIDAAVGTTAGVPSPVNAIEDTRSLVQSFARAYSDRLARWQQRLSQLVSTRSRVILWGAGAKGVSLLNLTPMGEIVSHVVDINPAKHGCYVPGTGQAIVAPDYLREYCPDLIVLTNPLYREEIARCLATVGVDADIEMA
jgi:hypothetical protein